MNDPHRTTSLHNERRRSNERDFLSFFFLGGGCWDLLHGVQFRNHSVMCKMLILPSFFD